MSCATATGVCTGCHRDGLVVVSRGSHDERVLCGDCAARPYSMPTANGLDSAPRVGRTGLPSGENRMSATMIAALAYAPRSIPLYPPDEFKAGDQRNGKAPSVGKGWQAWRATPDAIREHWQRRPDDNVGVRTGRGLVVLDIDPRAGGHDVLADLEHEHGELPATIEVATGGGGRHIYLHGPRDLPSFDLGAGVEVKAAGRQVVAPPSVHPDTAALYDWQDGRGPGQITRAPMPAWIAAGHTRTTGRRKPTPASEWVAIVRDGLAQSPGDGIPGRNNGLTRLVGHLLARDVDARLVAELAHLLNTARCRPPLDTHEVDQIVTSLAGREVRKRRGETP